MFNSRSAYTSAGNDDQWQSGGDGYYSNDLSDYPFTMQQYPPTDITHDYPPDESLTNSWTQLAATDEGHEPSSSPPARPVSTSSRPHHHQQQQQQQPAVPDAVINMAAKVSSDKKPFAYIADVNDIRQQRERVRRK